MPEIQDTEANYQEDSPQAVSRRLRHNLMALIENPKTTNNDRHRFARLLVDLLTAQKPIPRPKAKKAAKAKVLEKDERIALFGGKAK